MIVRVTQAASQPAWHRARLLEMGVEGPTEVVPPGEEARAGKSITLRASAAGLGSATIEIPIECDASVHGVLAVAESSVRLANLQ